MGKRIISTLTVASLLLSFGAFLAGTPTADASMYRSRDENDHENANANKNSSLPPALIACMTSAIEKRENSILTAWTTYADSLKTAYQTRRDALVASLGLSTKRARRDAIKTAWKEFKKSRKEARRAFNNARRSAWITFGGERKDCRAPSDGMGPSVDLQPAHND